MAIGQNSAAIQLKAVAIGQKTTAMHENSIAIGSGVSTTEENQVIIGDTNQKVVVQPLADTSPDAPEDEERLVGVKKNGELMALQSLMIIAEGDPIEDGQYVIAPGFDTKVNRIESSVTEIRSSVKEIQDDVTQLQEDLQKSVQSTEGKISALDTKIKRGLAVSSALSSLNLLSHGDKRFSVSAGVGYSDSETAFATGIGVKVAETEKIAVFVTGRFGFSGFDSADSKQGGGSLNLNF